MIGTANSGTGRSSIVLARSPVRVSLAGGGTDLPSYSDQFGSTVVTVAIDRYVAVTVHPRSFDGELSFAGEQAEHVSDAESMRNRFARAALLRAGVHRNTQITVCTDVPSGTGLGGSGAFTVALLHALRFAQAPSPVELAEEASMIEMVDLERPVGKHDHYIAAFGGIRTLHIQPSRQVVTEELQVPDAVRRYIRDRLLLFHTGLSRDAGQTLTEQDRATRHGDAATLASLHAIGTLVDPMADALRSSRIDEVGPLLHEHWSSKQRLGDGITNPRIDKLYQTALGAGSDGGKILGAGGGGFLLLSTRRGRSDELRAAMAAEGLRELAFGIDRTGSRATRLPA
jgi:D-glycero-alpha-D-manno-heptose-7-phosphate kinase